MKIISIPCLNELLLFGVAIWSKEYIIGTVYRFLSQNSDKFEPFLSNFEFLYQDILQLTPSLGIYKVRNTNWYHHDITTNEGFQLGTTTSIYGSSNWYTKFLIFAIASSCIDLIFSNQSHHVVNSVTHTILHDHCPHQITVGKVNLKIEHNQPHKRHACDYVKLVLMEWKKPFWKFVLME